MRRILIAEDDDRTRDNLKRLLATVAELDIKTVGDGKRALKTLTESDVPFSIFLTDLKMPELDGLEVLDEIRKRNLPVSTIVMTAFGSIEQAVEAMKNGAIDFLVKPVDPDHLRMVMQRALRERELQDEVLHLREQLEDRFSFRNIVSKSPKMHALFELISNIAHTNTTVLIEGATGTGKEMVAQAIHQASQESRSGPFVPVNCAALPENLLESELFGHEKGAFTGAIGQREGRFEKANGGTLFLDELGEVPLSTQVKLLRVLQERRFERIGGSTSIEVDVRLIAATNKRLSRLVKKGQFREDLYYRVNVVRIELPPLHERAEDIPLLAAHFTDKYCKPGDTPKKISAEAMELLVNYRWPGNVRELENVIERACVISKRKTIEPSHLPLELTEPSPTRLPFNVNISKPLPELLRETNAAIERRYIEKALKKSRGNVSRCAEICGLSRRSLTAKIGEYQIDKDKIKKALD